MAALIRSMFCYRIVRFFKGSGRRRIISSRVSLAMAKYHCSLDSSSRPGVWFDGFEIMPGQAEPLADEAANFEQPGYVSVLVEEDGDFFPVYIAVDSQLDDACEDAAESRAAIKSFKSRRGW